MSRAIHKMGFGGAETIRLTYKTAQKKSSISTNVATFSSVSIGSADPTRSVLVAVGYLSDSSDPYQTPAVTIGGFSATQLLLLQAYAWSNNMRTATGFYIYPIATGTSTSVVVTGQDNAFNCSMAAWTLTGSSSGYTLTDQDPAAGTSSYNCAGTVAVQNNGAAASFINWKDDTSGYFYSGASDDLLAADAAKAVSVGFSGQTASWSGLTEKFDQTISTPSGTNTKIAGFILGSFAKA